MRENALCSGFAGAVTATMAWLGLYGFAWSDYERGEPRLRRATHGQLAEFLRLAPAYGGSLVERAPFALLPALWGGGSLAVYRMVALPCLLAAASSGCGWSHICAMRLDSTMARAWCLVCVSPIRLRCMRLKSVIPRSCWAPACASRRFCLQAGTSPLPQRSAWVRNRQQGVGAPRCSDRSLGPAAARRAMCLALAGTVTVAILAPLALVASGGFLAGTRAMATAPAANLPTLASVVVLGPSRCPGARFVRVGEGRLSHRSGLGRSRQPSTDPGGWRGSDDRVVGGGARRATRRGSATDGTRGRDVAAGRGVVAGDCPAFGAYGAFGAGPAAVASLHARHLGHRLLPAAVRLCVDRVGGRQPGSAATASAGAVGDRDGVVELPVGSHPHSPPTLRPACSWLGRCRWRPFWDSRCSSRGVLVQREQVLGQAREPLGARARQPPLDPRCAPRAVRGCRRRARPSPRCRRAAAPRPRSRQARRLVDLHADAVPQAVAEMLGVAGLAR